MVLIADDGVCVAWPVGRPAIATQGVGPVDRHHVSESKGVEQRRSSINI
jgi:hypothetical protein